MERCLLLNNKEIIAEAQRQVDSGKYGSLGEALF